MSENVKDCPFCGCSVSVERVPLEHYQGCVIFKIKCSNCGCERTLTKNDSIYRTEEEARANAIAQWNERADVPPVPREMSAVEFLKEHHRMCNNINCEDCQICRDEEYPRSCVVLMGIDPDDTVSVVGLWAREHPERSEDNAKV